MLNLGDVRTINGKDIPPVDCLVGGSPCQNLSVAGNKEGLNGKESCLFYDQMRICRELREASNHKRPRFIVWENVPGALSSNSGKDFREVLNECVKIKESAPVLPLPSKGRWPTAGLLYDELGTWSIAWRVHNAEFWGVPQRRRRIALVCDFGGLSAGEILFESKSLHRNPEANKKERKKSTKTSHGSVEKASKSLFIDSRGNGIKEVAGTITGDHESRVTDYSTLVFGINGDAHESGIGVLNNKSHTLKTSTKESVISIANGQLNLNPIDGVSHTLNCMHDPETIIHNQQIRRLTPLECTRLQGYPDGWVDIGEWTDSKGRLHKETDQPKYKALGNSIALPFWKWLLSRIYKKLKETTSEPTLGSLFDGIGGFPLCWPGQTAWVAEVDEFCNAVTRYNFRTKDQT